MTVSGLGLEAAASAEDVAADAQTVVAEPEPNHTHPTPPHQTKSACPIPQAEAEPDLDAASQAPYQRQELHNQAHNKAEVHMDYVSEAEAAAHASDDAGAAYDMEASWRRRAGNGGCILRWWWW